MPLNVVETRLARRAAGVLSLLAACSAASCARNEALEEAESPRLGAIELPPGFVIELFADGVEGARSLARGDRGTVFVGTRDEGRVYALTDADGDGRAETTRVVADGMNQPNGVAFRDGDLFVAEIDKIWRFRGIERALDDPPKPELVTNAYPSDEHHGWKYIAFGPDGLLYAPVGAPCNICESEAPIYASITRLRVGGGEPEIFARGIRNSVGFDWHPRTGELWFTENGRDWMGDDSPPDELNRAPEPGLHFGYPHCHGGEILDPEFGEGRDCSEFVPPVRNLAPHTAALGMKFYEGDAFPEEYRGQVFIAEHGSWNRSEPIGYHVTLVRLDEEGRALSYEPFATGWLRGGEAWGRPVDLLELPDGSLLVSDDFGDAVYRIRYGD